MSERLLVTDIDGTLLDGGAPTPGLETLRLVLAAHRGSVGLIYATGRPFSSTWDLVESGALPEPNGVAAFVGTEAWMPPWDGPSPEFETIIRRGWDPDAVRATAASFPALEPQPDEFQTELKASYWAEGLADPAALERALEEAGVEARVVLSCGDLLDIVPVRAGKRNAVRHICRELRIDEGHIMACGDSGNDIDMLAEPRFRGVAVGNSEREILGLSKAGPLHESSLPFAAGVLEGAEAFDFWPTT